MWTTLRPADSVFFAFVTLLYKLHYINLSGVRISRGDSMRYFSRLCNSWNIAIRKQPLSRSDTNSSNKWSVQSDTTEQHNKLRQCSSISPHILHVIPSPWYTFSVVLQEMLGNILAFTHNFSCHDMILNIVTLNPDIWELMLVCAMERSTCPVRIHACVQQCTQAHS